MSARADSAPSPEPTVLNEIAGARGVQVEIEEASIQVREEVQAACEILDLNPLYVANEGRFVLFCPRREASRAVGCFAELRREP